MGTNFYIGEQHIGKRSAAGWYCWDCNISLCVGGDTQVHLSDNWYDACPYCGKKVVKESLYSSSAGRELGFNKSEPKKKSGVASCSSFSYAIKPEELVQKLNAGCTVVNEYGDKYTPRQFLEILNECPIRLYHMIGQEFS